MTPNELHQKVQARRILHDQEATLFAPLADRGWEMWSSQYAVKKIGDLEFLFMWNNLLGDIPSMSKVKSHRLSGCGNVTLRTD